MKNKKIIVILSVLLVISLGIGGFFAYKNFEKNGKETTDNSGNNKELDNNTTNDNGSKLTRNELIDRLMPSLVDCGFDMFFTDNTVLARDIPNSFAFELATVYRYIDGTDSFQSFTLEEIKKDISKYFGKDYVFNSGEYKTLCPNYIYDEGTATYIVDNTNLECGNTCMASTSYNVINESEINNTHIIDVKVIFIDRKEYGSNDLKFYGDYERTKVIGNKNDDLVTLFSKGADYRVTFKLEDGNYVFVSSSPIKHD